LTFLTMCNIIVKQKRKADQLKCSKPLKLTAGRAQFVFSFVFF